LQRLSLGDEYLDAPLGGGLGEGITELVGEAACGKTQLAMQMLIQVRERGACATSRWNARRTAQHRIALAHRLIARSCIVLS
jgi:RecA/RadA recombinase